ncbi:DUF3493 domain-containing protein [Cyanobium sp. BA20m-p-22]|uniref:DUF3493 domain-containing protein n=1 Tax=Cyanobium sp. BA20m-p-22 TaxID=2823704 RepID=UPI0037BF6C8E
MKLALTRLPHRLVPLPCPTARLKMGPNSDQIDPALRARLLQEVRTPWRGLRRGLWLALAASGAVGLATMAMRAASGAEVASADLLIQVGALGLFGSLLWLDRNRAGS